MTNEEIRIKIAESLGYKRRPFERQNYITWYNPSGKCISRIAHVGKLTELAASVPNYPESLDACAEFEKTLTWEEQEVFKVRLSRITADDFYEARTHWSPHTHHATARQRCLAYLQTKGII